jgi:hypothetical protein
MKFIKDYFTNLYHYLTDAVRVKYHPQPLDLSDYMEYRKSVGDMALPYEDVKDHLWVIHHTGTRQFVNKYGTVLVEEPLL